MKINRNLSTHYYGVVDFSAGFHCWYNIRMTIATIASSSSSSGSSSGSVSGSGSGSSSSSSSSSRKSGSLCVFVDIS